MADRWDRDVYVERIRSRLQDFVESVSVVQSIPVGEDDGSSDLEVWRFEQLPLLEQLAELVTPSNSGIGARMLASRPVVNTEALRVQARIRHEIGYWFEVLLRRRSPATTPLAMQTLSSLAPTLTDLQLSGLDDDVRRWWCWARVTTGWSDVQMHPHVRCINCDTRDSITFVPNLVTDSGLATCSACGEGWDEERIGLLRRHFTESEEAEAEGA